LLLRQKVAPRAMLCERRWQVL